MNIGLVLLFEMSIITPKTDCVDALSEEIALNVDGKARIARIVNESSDGFGELKFLIDLLEEEDSTGIGCELFGIELDGEGLPVEWGGVIHCVLVVCVWRCCKFFYNNILPQRPTLKHNAL